MGSCRLLLELDEHAGRSAAVHGGYRWLRHLPLLARTMHVMDFKRIL